MGIEKLEQDVRAAEDHGSYADGAAFVDGRFVPVAEARIPILDWGFLRSDATYDVAHVWCGIAPESVDPTVKNYHWLDLETGLLESYERGGETVILVDAEDNVVEGPGFNVFAVTNGTISTPDRGVLEGITRKTIIELAASHHFQFAARPVPADELRQADEVFLSSTAGGVIPVTMVDGEAVGKGKPGPLTRQLREVYWEVHDDPRFSLPVHYD
jgi:branched-chain amino acid aminotransferase